MAMPHRFAIGHGVRGGVTLCLGLREDGTRDPAPLAPQKKLVVVGFYRYVRNPMYLGFITGWIGLWIIFGKANTVAVVGAVAVVLGVALFVVLYEEPTLRRKVRCRVRRILPQCAALDTSAAAVGSLMLR
jgi:protein-S-isoprenylcysteine O-methyltransferase Ste14